MIATVIEIIIQALFIIVIILSVFHWVRTGFWVPKYIHYISLFMFIVGGGLAYIAYSDGNVKIFWPICIAVGFPISVFILYGLYGGGIHSKDIKINDGLVVDRAMLQDEVLEIFKSCFEPYTRWSFENLLMLTIKKSQEEYTGKSGKHYLFELGAESFDTEEHDKIVAVYGTLVEISKKFYKPKSHIVFEVNRAGTILRNGLSFNS